MIKKNYTTLLFFMIVIIIDWIYYITQLLSTNRLSYEITFFVLVSLLFFLMLINLIYKKLFDFTSSKFKILFYIVSVLLFSMFIANRILEINKYYEYSKTLPKKNSGNLWQPDKYLGHRGIKNAIGYYEYFIGDSISGKIDTRFDSLGYRTVNQDKLILSDTLNLFLGCSFTFGDYIKAGEGYPYITSKLLNHNFLNGGASAYGLGQMIQLVDSLVPEFKFKYVFIQMSPWLAYRATILNGPTFYGYRPFPYFYEKANEFVLIPPAYKTRMYNRRKNWQETDRSYIEKVLFMFTDGFNVEILDYSSNKLTKFYMKIGLLPKPTKKRLKLEKYFYDYAIKKIIASGATPIILKLKYNEKKCSRLLKHLRGKAMVIDLDFVLDSVVDSQGQSANKLFYIYHLHQGKKIYYDGHLNAYANEIVGNYIFENLNKK